MPPPARLLLPPAKLRAQPALGTCSATKRDPQEQSPSTARGTVLHKRSMHDQAELNGQKASSTHALILR